MKLDSIIKESDFTSNDFQTNTYNTTVKADLNLRSGTVIPKGTKVSCNFSTGSHTMFTIDFGGEKPLRLYYSAAHKYLAGFKKPPSMNALQKMSDEGIATTPLGNRTEPDGTGPFGDPSWLLVIGLI